MNIYYEVLVFRCGCEPTSLGSRLLENHGNTNYPWGTTHATGEAYRFDQEQDAADALEMFLSYNRPGGSGLFVYGIYDRGTVVRVMEEEVTWRVKES